MDTQVATPLNTQVLPSVSQPNHKYGTRTRQNSVMRPSVRLRGTPDTITTQPQPRKIRPAPVPKPYTPNAQPAEPVFPPPGAQFHKEDANSKVFMAVGRALLAIDNRAVTIKDLAEMTMAHGFDCQSANAASQAITTYIRNHLRRCEEENDVPLLSRHVLSGTASDDDLLPGLHSRSGGAHCDQVFTDSRLTNFRKGTIVWFLSTAAGGECPFTRAGIRLCEYGPDGRSDQKLPLDPKERRRERDRARRAARCGEKRKRLAGTVNTPTYDSDSDLERRPPKVKLTLRLKPLGSSPPAEPLTPPIIPNAGSDDDSMSSDEEDEDEDPEWPSSPPWTSALNPVHSTLVSSLDGTPMSHDASSTSHTTATHHRSSSVPHSIASVPPDSEEEDEDFHISMKGPWRSGSRNSSYSNRWFSEDEDMDSDWPLNFDFDRIGRDTDDETTDSTTWGESPVPLSPPPILADISTNVKVENYETTVQGMLDAWEDLDKRVAGSKLVEVVARAAAGEYTPDSPFDGFSTGSSSLAPNPFNMWEWEQYGGASPPLWRDDPPFDGWSAPAPLLGSVEVKLEHGSQNPNLAPTTEPASASPVFSSLAKLRLDSPVLERAEISQPSAPVPETKAESAPQRSGLLWQSTSSWTPSNEVGISPASFAVAPHSAQLQEEHVKIPLTPSEALAAATAALSDSSHLDGHSSKRDSGSSIRTLRPLGSASSTSEATYIPWAATVIPLGTTIGQGAYTAPLSSPPPALDEVVNVKVSPLSPTEAEIFRSLCVLGEDSVLSSSEESNDTEIDLDSPMTSEVAAPVATELAVMHPTEDDTTSECDETVCTTPESKPRRIPKTRAAVAAAAAAASKPKREPTRRSTRLASGPSENTTPAVRVTRSKVTPAPKRR